MESENEGGPKSTAFNDVPRLQSMSHSKRRNERILANTRLVTTNVTKVINKDAFPSFITVEFYADLKGPFSLFR